MSPDDESSPVVDSNQWESRYFTPSRSDESHRSEFERDRDRILYSDGFHRLSGITQVARSGENYPYHTRLTHSQKVSQVGRRLSQYLNREYGELQKDDIAIPEVVSAAALAHDLGHPPFGHAAEEELDHLISTEGADDGFEGNPQSFRIVGHVETNALYRDHPDDRGKGLNLTKRTLNGILKYPWEEGESIPDEIGEDTSKKFGYYASEEDLFQWAREGVRDYFKTPEAKLMDWADDVTYAVHDLIDFYRVGVIPLEQILQETAERDAFIEHFNGSDKYSVHDSFDPKQFLRDTLREGLNEPEIKTGYSPTRGGTSLVDLLQSTLIEKYLRVPDTVWYVSPGESRFDDGLGEVKIDPIKRSEVEFLKAITFHYVIKSSSLTSQQHGERRAISAIFSTFLAASDENYAEEYGDASKYDLSIVPYPFRQELADANTRGERCRILGDVITSLTESQAIALYERISGRSE